MKIVESFRNTFKEFRSFALRANALDLAIGVSLGAAFTTVVHAIVADLFTPLIAAVWGNVNVSTLSFQIHGTTFNYGQAVNGAVSLFIVAATLFFFVVKPLNGLRRRLGLDTSASLPKAPCPSCFTEIDIRSKRCASCTEPLQTNWSEEA